MKFVLPQKKPTKSTFFWDRTIRSGFAENYFKKTKNTAAMRQPKATK